MADDHEHHHDHHGHDHEGHDEPNGAQGQFQDPAGQSLADALRVSFRLLSLIMVLVGVAFLVTGIKSVEPNQRGIKTVFGRIIGEPAGPGLTATWPFPVGRVITLPVATQTFEMDDFWMYETPEAKKQKLEERQAAASLDPARDGALLTGDGNLIHVRLYVTYEVADPLAAQTHVTSYESLVRAAIRRAAVMAASTRTADSILLLKGSDSAAGAKDKQSDFTRAVELRAQKRLEEWGAGVRIGRIAQENATLPLAVLPAYQDARKADSEALKLRTEGRHEAVGILNAAAGEKYSLLLGDPEKPLQLVDPTGRQADYNLIGRYDKAVQDGDVKAADQLLERIGQLLEGNDIIGQARKIISDARSEESRIVQEAATWVERYRKLASGYRERGAVLMEMELTSTLERMFSSDTVEKVVLQSGPNEVVIKTSEDPDIVERIRKRVAEKNRELEEKLKQMTGEKE